MIDRMASRLKMLEGISAGAEEAMADDLKSQYRQSAVGPEAVEKVDPEGAVSEKQVADSEGLPAVPGEDALGAEVDPLEVLSSILEDEDVKKMLGLGEGEVL